MSLTRILTVLLVALVLAVVAVPAFSQDNATTLSAGMLERWEELSPEERRQVARAFEEWKRLSPEQQEELADRHRSLGKARDEVLTALPAPDVDRIRRMRHRRERNRALKPHLKKFLAEERRRVLELADLPAPAGEKLSFSKIKKLSKEYTAVRLRQLEADGHLPEGEAEQLRSLSPRALKRALRELQKQLVLQHPPKPFLKLPDEKRKELMDLDPENFMREVRRIKGRQRQKNDLPPMMRDLLHGRRKPPARPLPDRRLFRILGPEQYGQLNDLPAGERRRVVGRILREKARAALTARGEDPHVLDVLEDLSPEERDRRLADIIDGERKPPRHRERNDRGRNGRRRP